MRDARELIWLAGAVQLAMVVMNAALPRYLKTKENLTKVEPIVRQVFYSHWIFVMLAVVIFSVPCFAFSADVAGESALGRYLSAGLAAFWLLKLWIQFFRIDANFRGKNRFADVLVAVGTLYLIVIFGGAAGGVLR